MLWRQKKTVEFAADDVRTLVELVLPKLIEKLGEPIYVSDDGDVPALVTQSEVSKQVEQLLREAATNLDTLAIAAQLSVPKSSVDAVVRDAAERTGSLFDGVHVLGTRRLDAIGDTLLAKNGAQITRLSDVCEAEKITLQAAAAAVRRKAPELSIVGRDQEYVVPGTLLSEHVSQFKSRLETATEPVLYTSIEPDSVLLPLIKQRLDIPQHETEYRPPVYVERRMAEAEKLLQTAGYVAFGDVEEPSKFARRTNSVIIDSNPKRKAGTSIGISTAWIVSREFIAKQQRLLNSDLSKQGFADLRETALYPELARYIIENSGSSNSEAYNTTAGSGDGSTAGSRDSPQPQTQRVLSRFQLERYPRHFLVKPSLERDLIAKINKELAKEAEEKAGTLDLRGVNGASTLAEYAAKIPLPPLARVAELVDTVADTKIPAELRISDQILPQVRKEYATVSSNALRPRFEAAVERLEAKVRCYLNAVLSVPADSELRSIAWDELQQYVSDQQFPVPSSIAAAEQQFRVHDNSLLQRTAEELRGSARTKLQRAASKLDAALVLHVAGTIYHSLHFMDTPGFLKIRGKAVPKLIKQYEFPACYDELRRQLKTPPPELINAVCESIN